FRPLHNALMRSTDDFADAVQLRDYPGLVAGGTSMMSTRNAARPSPRRGTHTATSASPRHRPAESTIQERTHRAVHAVAATPSSQAFPKTARNDSEPIPKDIRLRPLSDSGRGVYWPSRSRWLWPT